MGEMSPNDRDNVSTNSPQISKIVSQIWRKYLHNVEEISPIFADDIIMT